MKNNLLLLFLLFAVIISTTAQYSILHEFADSLNGINPGGDLTVSGNILYGMTTRGGANNMGCIFKINNDSSKYTKLLDFNGASNGRYPSGSLTLADTFLYGTTWSGGLNGMGCIFKINANGTVYTKLFDFSGTSNGRIPAGTLILSGNTLYGTTNNGGTNDIGCIFKINTDGTGFTKLHNFTSLEGANPCGKLVLSGSFLYGSCTNGGTNFYGTIYKIKTDGTLFTKMHDFNGIEGRNPGSLTIAGSVLYGMTTYGDSLAANGCIFKINTNSTGYAVLHGFSEDGRFPNGALINSGCNLYGMTKSGDYFFKQQYGTIFQIDTGGNNFNTLLMFNRINGGTPMGSLIFSGNTMYGMTSVGGANNFGVIFKYNPSQTTKISFSDYQVGLVNIHWVTGNGDKRAVFVKQDSGAITNPGNNTTYTASADWKTKGTQLGSSGYYCVYNGTGDSVTLTGLSLGTLYAVQVFEYSGAAGAEQYVTDTAKGNPNSFTSIKYSQTILFNSIPPQNIINNSFALMATASSGLPVTFTSKKPSLVKITGNIVTMLVAGDDEITASQGGDSMYYPAPTVMHKLTVYYGPGLEQVNDLITNSYPNPFNSVIRVIYELDMPADVSIEIINQTGIRIGQLKFPNQPTGQNIIEIDAEKYNMTPGMYLIRICAGDKISMVRCIYEK